MPRNSALPAGFLFLLFLLTSCNTKVTISILKPGLYTLPTSVQKLTIYSKPAMLVNPGYFDSIPDFQFEDGTDINKIRQGYLFGLYETMSGSPRFKKVVLSDTVFDKQLIFGNLTWKTVDMVCGHDTSDALLMLWKAVSYASHDNTSYFSGQSDALDLSHILNRSQWILFKPFAHQQLASYRYTDTVSLGPGIFLNPGNYGDILYQNCFLMGKAFGEKICPHWEEVERIMYVGPGRELRKATAFTADNKWVEAGAIWDRLAESPHKKQASRAAYNLALAFERDDVLDQAMLWITYADSLNSTAASSGYKKLLEGRLRVKPLLDDQMAGN